MPTIYPCIAATAPCVLLARVTEMRVYYAHCVCNCLQYTATALRTFSCCTATKGWGVGGKCISAGGKVLKFRVLVFWVLSPIQLQTLHPTTFLTRSND